MISAEKNITECKEKFISLKNKLIDIAEELDGLVIKLRATAEGKSKEYDSDAESVRIKAYAGCLGLILPPLVLACEAIAVGVVESELKKYRDEVKAF